jgi:hypothetical protein
MMSVVRTVNQFPIFVMPMAVNNSFQLPRLVS